MAPQETGKAAKSSVLSGTEQDSSIESSVCVDEQGRRQAICGYTWPGIEYGEPPSPAYTFFEYVEAVRNGTLEEFKSIQEESKEWWFPSLDRGAGALLHFAVDHGRLDMVKYLVEEEDVPINQKSLNGGWTPLHRCARIIHYKHAPFFDIFEYLLQHGADPTITTNEEGDKKAYTPYDLVVQKGYQWSPGEVRSKVKALLDSYAAVKKSPPYIYNGPPVGEVAHRVMSAWRRLPALYPPDSWSGPIPPGCHGAMGMRRHDTDPWRPAGQEDGTCFY